MSTPSDTLRAAAARIREVAQAATPGPWCAYTDEVCTDWHPHSTDYAKHDGDIDVADGTGGSSDHIALWSPPVAEAVAELLVAASKSERAPGRNRALAVARLVLGEVTA